MGAICCSSDDSAQPWNLKTHGFLSDSEEEPSRCLATAKTTVLEEKDTLRFRLSALSRQTEDDLDPEEISAHHQPHTCTDCGCVAVLVLVLICIGFIFKYAADNSDTRQITRGIDWYGKLCGVNQDVVERPYLYWCPVAGDPLSPKQLEKHNFKVIGKDGEMLEPEQLSGQLAVHAFKQELDFRSPICVEKCPIDDQGYHPCFQKMTPDVKKDLVTDDFSEAKLFDLAFVQDYPTQLVASRYCMPRDQNMLNMVSRVDLGYFFFHAHEVATAWPVLVVAFTSAIAFGFFYILLMRCMSCCVVWGTIVTSVIIPMTIGIGGFVLIYMEERGQNEPKLVETIEEKILFPTTDLNRDIALCSLFVALGLVTLLYSCCWRKRFEVVVGSVDAAFECMWQLPGIFFFPLMSATLRIAYMVAAVFGFVWVLSIGKVQAFGPSDGALQGVMRNFHMSFIEKAMLGFYAFVAVWGFELVMAVDSFVFAYVTSRWYFKGSDAKNLKIISNFVFWRGYYLAWFYHLGSLVLGSFVLAFFRPLRLFLLFLQFRMEAFADSGSMVPAQARNISACCCCCLKCWEGLVRFLNDEAYIVVAAESRDFCLAAERAFNIMMSQARTASVLRGATALFQLAATICITTGGTMLSWFLVNTLKAFSNSDSPDYIGSPVIIVFVGGLVSFIVSLCFIGVFGRVCDSMLFCWTLDMFLRLEGRCFDREVKVPAGLQKLTKTNGNNTFGSFALLKEVSS